MISEEDKTKDMNEKFIKLKEDILEEIISKGINNYTEYINARIDNELGRIYAQMDKAIGHYLQLLIKRNEEALIEEQILEDKIKVLNFYQSKNNEDTTQG